MMKTTWLACIAAAGLLPLAALAHAKLLSTAPATGEQLAAAPKALTLRFNEAVQIGVLKVSADGKDVPIELDRGAAASPTVTVALPVLAPATYRVQWSALTVDDGHVVKGTFSFVVTGGH
ncbi:MAG: copper resistance CopC family protein [Steroidobacteraceae bacterium]|jgi:methionine-rich copper-binding protein CopC